MKDSGALFLVGIISGLIFIEIYGFYSFFTERYQYIEDLKANRVWSFTTFYTILNILIVFYLVPKVVRNCITREKY